MPLPDKAVVVLIQKKILQYQLRRELRLVLALLPRRLRMERGQGRKVVMVCCHTVLLARLSMLVRVLMERMVMKVMCGAGFKGEGSRLKSKVEWTKSGEGEKASAPT